MSKYVPARELAKILGFTVVGKLRRLPDGKYGMGYHAPLYIDEGGNEYHLGKRDDVCCGCIVDAEGRIY